MLVQKKIQLSENDINFIEKVYKIFNYKSKSEYMRQAILEKIKSDKRRLREIKRQKAMEGYGSGKYEVIFDSIEGEDFEDR